jgi:glycosyltransferase involved in cell wall biosynthesis
MNGSVQVRPMLRLAILLPTLDGGGAERMMLNLAGGLRALGAAVDLVVVSPRGAFAGQLTEGRDYVTLNCGRARTALPALRRFLTRTRPDVLLSTLAHGNVLSVAAARSLRRRPRIVIREATSVGAAMKGDRARIRRALLVNAMRATYRWADAIVAVSEGAKAELVKNAWLAPDAVTVIRNPVFNQSLTEAANRPLNHPWFDNEGPPPLLGVGRLIVQKNYPLLLAAFARARRVKPWLRLVILGDGEDRQALEAQSADLGLHDSIRFEGFVANPYAFMSRAAALVLSSTWEGSPNVIPEALACGCPVIATDCPNGPREILDGGRYGCLVPSGSPEALAQGIVDVLDNPPDGERLRQRARDYSVETSSEAYLELFNRLVADPA